MEIRKFQYGGISGEDIKNGANLIGEYFLKGLGVFGKLAMSPFVQQGPTSATIYKSKDQLAKERTIQNKSEQQLGNAMTWTSPLNYGVALATGNGLNARKGEEEITQWAPAWQALGRAAELYAVPTDLFIQELDKCVCICSNCHKKLHNGLLELCSGVSTNTSE